MRPGIPLIVGLLLLALLTWMCSCHVQDDILQRSVAELSASGHDWAAVDVDGRYVTLMGVAPTDDRLADASDAVRSLDGVLRVETDVLVHQVTDRDLDPVRQELTGAGYRWVELNRAERTLELGGLAGSQEDSDSAAALAIPQWPWGPLENGIRVASTPNEQAAVACRSSLETVIADRTVGFQTGSALLSSDDRAFLREIAAVLRGCPRATVKVEAHSDNTGGAESNMTLSGTRAEAVRAYLRTAGVAARRLSAEGFGETRPIAPNDTEEGRAQNRRVEFKIES